MSRSLPAASKKASPRSSGSRDPAAKCPASFAAEVSSVTDESGSHHQVGSSSTTCCGSKTHAVPTPARRSRVAWTTSGLFDVVMSAPGAARIAGTTSEVVLPTRGPAMPTTTSSHDA